MFCPCVLFVTVIGLYVPYIMQRQCCFSDRKYLMRIWAFPLRPGYIRCGTRIFFKELNSTDSIMLTVCQNLIRLLESLELSYSGVFVMTLSCKVPASTSVLSYLPLATSPLPYISSFIEFIHEFNYH